MSGSPLTVKQKNSERSEFETLPCSGYRWSNKRYIFVRRQEIQGKRGAIASCIKKSNFGEHKKECENRLENCLGMRENSHEMRVYFAGRRKNVDFTQN